MAQVAHHLVSAAVVPTRYVRYAGKLITPLTFATVSTGLRPRDLAHVTTMGKRGSR